MIMFLALAMSAGAAAAEEEGTAIPGEHFPDFTATDTEGNTFTLSEALNDYKAAPINFFTAWCGLCRFKSPTFRKRGKSTATGQPSLRCLRSRMIRWRWSRLSGRSAANGCCA